MIEWLKEWATALSVVAAGIVTGGTLWGLFNDSFAGDPVRNVLAITLFVVLWLLGHVLWRQRKEEKARVTAGRNQQRLQAEVDLLTDRLDSEWLVHGRLHTEWLVKGPRLSRMPADEFHVLYSSYQQWCADPRELAEPSLASLWDQHIQALDAFVDTYSRNSEYDSVNHQHKGPLDDDFEAWQKINDACHELAGTWQGILKAYYEAKRTLETGNT